MGIKQTLISALASTIAVSAIVTGVIVGSEANATTTFDYINIERTTNDDTKVLLSLDGGTYTSDTSNTVTMTGNSCVLYPLHYDSTTEKYGYSSSLTINSYKYYSYSDSTVKGYIYYKNLYIKQSKNYSNIGLYVTPLFKGTQYDVDNALRVIISWDTGSQIIKYSDGGTLIDNLVLTNSAKYLNMYFYREIEDESCTVENINKIQSKRKLTLKFEAYGL